MEQELLALHNHIRWDEQTLSQSSNAIVKMAPLLDTLPVRHLLPPHRQISFFVENVTVRGGLGLIRNRTPQCPDTMRRVQLTIRSPTRGDSFRIRLRPIQRPKFLPNIEVALTHQLADSVARKIEPEDRDDAFRCWAVEPIPDSDVCSFLDFNAWRDEMLVPLRLSLSLAHSALEAELCSLLWGRKEIKHMGQTKGFSGTVILFE